LQKRLKQLIKKVMEKLRKRSISMNFMKIMLLTVVISSCLPIKAISLDELCNSHVIMQDAYGKDNNENKSENRLLDKIAKVLVITVGVLVIIKASYDFSTFVIDRFCPLPVIPYDGKTIFVKVGGYAYAS